MLCLKAETGVLRVSDAMTTREAPVKEVSGIELHARFGGINGESAPAYGIGHLRRHPQRSRLPVQHPVEVIAAGSLELFIVRVDPRSNCLRLAEVHRRAGD